MRKIQVADSALLEGPKVEHSLIYPKVYNVFLWASVRVIYQLNLIASKQPQIKICLLHKLTPCPPEALVGLF